MNEILSNLKPYPFEKLNKLLKEINPKIKNKVDFSIGDRCSLSFRSGRRGMIFPGSIPCMLS